MDRASSKKIKLEAKSSKTKFKSHDIGSILTPRAKKDTQIQKKTSKIVQRKKFRAYSVSKPMFSHRFNSQALGDNDYPSEPTNTAVATSKDNNGMTRLD